MPWLVVGGFNYVLKVDNKIGANPVTWAEVMDFHHCIKECELIELPHVGGSFTWHDKGKAQRVFSKINWMFINHNWLDIMHDTKARYLPEGINDYCAAKNYLRRRWFKIEKIVYIL